MMESRPVLYSREAEEHVIGSILTDPTAILRVATILTPDSFELHRHKVIFKAALAISQRNGVTDPITMIDELRNTNQLEAAGTTEGISYLYGQVGSGVFAEYFAAIVAKHERQRALLAASKVIEDLAYEPDVDTAQAKAMELLLQKGKTVMRSLSPRQRAEYAAKLTYDLMDNDKASLLSFGFPSLDRLGGMSGGDLVLLGADTKRGKSTLIHQVVRHVARTFGHVMIFSLEMSEKEVTIRDIARLCKMYIPAIQKGGYSPEVFDKIVKACPEIEGENFSYYFPTRCTVPMIYYEAKRQQIENDLVMIIVDYVQLLRDSGKYESEPVKYANISHDLKDVARELDVPIIEVSQYARGTADDNHKYKGSSAWEQDASWLLHYSIEEAKDGSEHTYITVGGIRQRGETAGGRIELIYNALSQSFEEV